MTELIDEKSIKYWNSDRSTRGLAGAISAPIQLVLNYTERRHEDNEVALLESLLMKPW